MRRSFAILLAAGLLMIGSLGLASGATAVTTIGPTTRCSNSADNTGGLGLICQVTVRNAFTASGGSATVTVRECHGAAGDPTAACTTQTTSLTTPVTSVRQCNGSINGGGGTLRCSVRVINTFAGVDIGRAAVTVNQCVGSGGGITIGCDPFPATTTGATVTQCNGSANGGTLVGLTCTVAGSQSSTHRITINQCNGSANGGGALVICSARIANTLLGGGGGGPTVTPRPTTPPTDTAATTPVAKSESTPVLFAAIFLLAFVVLITRWSLRAARTR